MVLGLCGGGIHLLHRVQMGRNASSLLDRARTAEAGGNLARAEESLSLYLGLRRDDSAAWAWYARLTDERTKDKRGRERVFLVNEEALRKNPDNRKLERRCAELALELERHSEARRHLIQLNEAIQADPEKAAEAAELEDLLGQCDQPESKFDEAEQHYRKSIALDITRVVTFDRLARLLRQERKNPAAADRAIEEMLKANPKSALSHIKRWRYRREFGPAAGGGDIAQALELGPDEAEVLIAAAELARQGKDIAAARKHIDWGLDRHPEDARIYLMAAELELAENHADRAEAVLRRGIAAVPSNVPLKMMLVETLISERKVAGEDGAIAWIERLRTMGLAAGYAAYFDGRVAMVEARWLVATSRLESAQALLAHGSDPGPAIDLLLAECYQHSSGKEKRTAALQTAVDRGRAGPAALMLAEALESDGRLEEAVRLHSDLVATRAESRLDLVRLWIKKTLRLPPDRRSWSSLENRLEEARKVVPRETVALTLLRADLLAAEGLRDQARTLLESTIRAEPRQVAYHLALVRLDLDDPGEPMAGAKSALQRLDQAERVLGRHHELTRARVEALARQGGSQARQAIDTIAAELESTPAVDQPALMEALAKAFALLGETSRVIQLTDQLASRQPDDLSSQLRLLDAAAAVGDVPSLQRVAERIRLIEGEGGKNWKYADGLYHLELARAGDSQAFDQVKLRIGELQQSPDWWGAPALLGQVDELQNRPDEAVRNYLWAVTLGNDKTALTRRLAGLLYSALARNNKLEQFDEVDRIVRQATERGQAVGELTLVRAMRALSRNRTSEGLELAREAANESVHDPSQLLKAGRLLLSYGKPDDAERAFRGALALAPGMSDAWLAYIQLLARTSRLDQAVKLAGELGARLSAEQAELVQAQAYELLGDRGHAEAAFAAALGRRPADPAVLRPAAEFFARFAADKAMPLIDRLVDPATKASPADLAWARQTKVMLGATSGVRLDEVDQALAAVESMAKAGLIDVGEQRTRALLLSLRYSSRKQAVELLEDLDRKGKLGTADRFVLALLYSAERDWGRCKEEMLRVLQGESREPRHLAFYVAVLTELKQFDEATRRLGELKAALPANQAVLSLELESKLLKAQGRDQQAVSLLQADVQRNPADAGAAGAILDRLDRAREAEPFYRRSMDQAPTQPQPVLTMAAYLARHDRCDEAVKLAESVQDKCSAEQLCLATLSLFDARSSTEAQRSRAEAWLMRALQSRPDDLVLLGKLASIRGRQGKYEEAETLYRRILAANKDHLEALNNLAWLIALRGQNTNEAAALATRALDLAGPVPAVLDTYAAVLMRQGFYDRALETLEEAIRVGPAGPIRLFHLALAHQGAKHSDAARQAMRKAEGLGLDEKSVDARERSSYRTLRRDLGLQ